MQDGDRTALFRIVGWIQPRMTSQPFPCAFRVTEAEMSKIEPSSFQLADLLNVSRATSHRYAKTHFELGNLGQGDKRRYFLAGRAADPGTTVIATINRAPKARLVLEGLRNETGHTVSLGVLHERLHVHKRGQYVAR
jgi:DNA-binding IclR family transcriptional regulator